MNIKKKIPSAAAQNKERTLISPRMLALVTQPRPPFFISRMEVGFVEWQTVATHTHTSNERRDASSLQSLRQRLLCVIAPSPTRFTPYILSSSHLPHLHLPLCRPRSASPLHSLPPTVFSPLRTPFLSSSLPSSDWKVQLVALLFTGNGFLADPPPHPPPPALPPSWPPQWQHVFPWCCWLSLCVS